MWEQHKCPSADRMDMMRFIHGMEYQSHADARSCVSLADDTRRQRSQTVGHRLCDSIYMHCSKEVKPPRQKVDWWLPRAGGLGMKTQRQGRDPPHRSDAPRATGVTGGCGARSPRVRTVRFFTSQQCNSWQLTPVPAYLLNKGTWLRIIHRVL